MLAPDQFTRLTLPELQEVAGHQRDPRLRYRREPFFTFALIRRLRNRGLAVDGSDGPWIVGERPLPNPGRGGLRFIPTVERDGRPVLMLTEPEQARTLAGFMNWADVPAFAAD